MSSAANNEPKLEKRSSRAQGGGGGPGRAVTGNTSSNAAKLKILVRKLPPAMTEDEFKTHTAEWIDFDNIEYFSFVKGKVSEDRAKASRHAGSSIKFKSQEQIVALREGIEGRIFTDSRGNQARPQVEFAPFQKIPKKTTKRDARQGTIDQDPEYIAFLEILKTGAPLQAASTLPSINATVNPADGVVGTDKPLDKPTSTPLIEFIRAQKAAGASASAAEKAAKKEKESRREKRSTERKGKASGKATVEKEKEREKEKEKATQKAVKLAVRVVNSEGAAAANRRSKNTAETPVTPTASDTWKVSTPQGTPVTASASAKPPRRERGTATIAAAILQRDLGLGGPLQRKDRRGGGGNAQQATTLSMPTDQASGEGSAQPTEPTPQTVPENAPSESGSQSQQKPIRRNRRRDRGGQNGRESNPQTPTSEPLKAPISILKKQNTSIVATSGDNLVTPVSPQILKREKSTTSNPPEASTAPQSLSAPATAQPSITTTQQTQAPAQSPIGPRGGRGPRLQRSLRGVNASNVPAVKAGNAVSTGASSSPKAPNQPSAMAPTAIIPAPAASSSQPTTPTVPTNPPATNTGTVLGVAGKVPSGPAASTGSNVGSHGPGSGRGGHWHRGGPRGGGFPMRGVSGRGGRGRGSGGGGMRGGPQGGNGSATME